MVFPGENIPTGFFWNSFFAGACRIGCRVDWKIMRNAHPLRLNDLNAVPCAILHLSSMRTRGECRPGDCWRKQEHRCKDFPVFCWMTAVRYPNTVGVGDTRPQSMQRPHGSLPVLGLAMIDHWPGINPSQKNGWLDWVGLSRVAGRFCLSMQGRQPTTAPLCVTH